MSKRTTWIILGTEDTEARTIEGTTRDSRASIAQQHNVDFDRVLPVFA